MRGPGRQWPFCISRETRNKLPTFGAKRCTPPSGMTESLRCPTVSIVGCGPYIFGRPFALKLSPSARDLTCTATKYHPSAVHHSQRSSCSHAQQSVTNAQNFDGHVLQYRTHATMQCLLSALCRRTACAISDKEATF